MARQVLMPALSQSMLQGRIVKWLKKEGDKVTKGEPLVTVESDKAEVDLDSPHTGILTSIIADEDMEVDVDAPIALIDDSSDSSETAPTPSVSSAPSRVEEVNLPITAEQVRPTSASHRAPATPRAKRLATEHGVDLALITGTGPDGMVTDKDVMSFVAASATDAGTMRVVELKGIRGSIAERMSHSRQTAADVTTIVDVDMQQVDRLRGVKRITYTSAIVWAVAHALRDFPIINSWIVDDRILIRKDVNIGVAVSLDGALVVPVLRNADAMGVSQIDEEIGALATRARNKSIVPDDMKGGTFTVTNSGTFGSLMFTPIINQPQVAILGVGKVHETAVVRSGQIVVSKVAYLCLSYDHRAVDGEPAVRFLQSVKQNLETIAPSDLESTNR